MLEVKPFTVEDFDEFALLPENADRNLEFIGGNIVEVVSNSYSSESAATILIELGIFIKGKNLGRITGADGGYRIFGERYIPDVAFISYAKQPNPSHEAYNPIPPDLAVEVLSPSNKENEIRIKIVNYLRAGTLVWLVDPDRKLVEIYAPDQPPRIIGMDGTLDGGTVLPGFTLAVKDIFPQQQL